MNISVEYKNGKFKFDFSTFKGTRIGNRLSQISSIQILKNGSTILYLEQKKAMETKTYEIGERGGEHLVDDEVEIDYGPGIQVLVDNTGNKISEHMIMFNSTIRLKEMSDRGYGIDYYYGTNGQLFYKNGDGIRTATANERVYKLGRVDTREKGFVISFKSALNNNYLMTSEAIILPRLVFGSKLKLEYFIVE